ncbi:MAG TPA: ABC transporter permease, partial [Amycolatopsis sp.]|nr:ABC transporter permease [Amycolatopsis sp.]
MTNAAITFGPALVIVLVLLAVAAAAVVGLGELGSGRAVLLAAVRAVVQLAVISFVITAVLRSFPLTGLFVLLMFSVAAFTSARRIGVPRQVRWVAPAIAAGVV